MFDWSIYILFVLNRGWKSDSLQIMIFVNVCSTSSLVEVNAFSDVNIKKLHKWCKFVSPFSYNNTYGLPVFTMDTKWPKPVFLIFDWSIYRFCVLNSGWNREYLQLIIYVNVCSTWSKVGLKTRFKTWITRNDVNGFSLFHLSYLITHMIYLCSQCTPNIKITYFMFGWSIHIQFVLNRARKRECLEIIIFVYVFSTWSIVVIKTHFRPK
jgi:hypothetical protein